MFEKEVLEIAKDIYLHHFDDDVKYPDVLNAIIIGAQRGAEFGYNKALEENNKLKEKLKNLESVADFQTSSNMKRYFQLKRSKEKITEAKTIIQDLLDNSDEYARQRAIDFLKEE